MLCYDMMCLFAS